MELKPRSNDKIIQLLEKGVEIPNPLSLDIGDEVKTDNISGNGVTIYPGCRIYGEEVVISGGVRIGYEGPVTIENCQLGPNVELKAGYFKKAVFLEKANMASGAHVRDGCILEEQANGAHCVGLKQTILFPFVTLGSLINFCDCLMAGGTSRKDHSEVGSAYIHFNFTPDSDKTTASLIGDVPRGVMLNQSPIFLGGQGGMVGPVRMGYGNIVAAGTILRNDVTRDNKLIVGKSHRGKIVDFIPRSYPHISRVVENNIIYLANLMALEQWYIHVRHMFFRRQEFGERIYSGALGNIVSAKEERIKRLTAMANNIAISLEKKETGTSTSGKREFCNNITQVAELFNSEIICNTGVDLRNRFLDGFHAHSKDHGGDYIDVVQSLAGSISQRGTRWLERIINEICLRTKEILPLLGIFKNSH
ncbi:MAG: UDP-N-acetylglucosamine pyrophosphorylase [Deltaproteobacteria bacterium]|nr:UDP-N-acetylglucosamine pyrophosphorylase [Deltaproteobacteria bacterium]